MDMCHAHQEWPKQSCKAQYLEAGEETDRKGDGDNISEWTGMRLSETLWLAEQRDEWRDLVAKASVAPPRSTKRLRDR